MVKILHWTTNIERPVLVGQDALAGLLHRKGSGLWIDILASDEQPYQELLEQSFNFHPLAVADAIRQSHIPRVDDWGSYLYLVIDTAPANLELLQEELPELDIFLGDNYLVTYHSERMPAIDHLWDYLVSGALSKPKSAARTLYYLTSEVATGFMAIADLVETEIDRVEDLIFDSTRQNILEDIAHIKKAALNLHRALVPQREVFSRLARPGILLLDDEDRLFFRDAGDQFTHLTESSNTLRDLANSSMDTYLSMVNNRMNDIVRLLTIITTLFMPLTFLTGFFGMNFFQAVGHLDHWTALPAFIVVMVIMIGSPVGMLIWMRKRGWL